MRRRRRGEGRDPGEKFARGPAIGVIVCLMWGFLFSFKLYASIRVLAAAGGYSRATFTVQEVHFETHRTGSSRHRHTSTHYYAMGKVDGRRETYSLESGVLPRVPQSQAELEAMVPAGTTYDVLYNPEMPGLQIQDVTLRLIPFDDDPAGNALKSAVLWGVLGWGPLAVLLGVLGMRKAKARGPGRADGEDGPRRGSDHRAMDRPRP